MRGVFIGLYDLTFLDIHIKTPNVENMSFMFDKCGQLTSLDLSSFYTPSLIMMEQMFNGCYKLTFLNISNYNTSKIVNMYELFAECYELTSLDVSNFDTSQVTNMKGMFYALRNLKYIDLSNFDTSKVIDMANLFEQCTSLIYLNLYSFNISRAINITRIFYQVPENAKICINDLETIDILSGENRTFNCLNLCFKDNKKIYLNQNQCFYYCDGNQNMNELDKFCHENCTLKYPTLFEGNYICLEKVLEKYYFDKNNNIYKAYYKTCLRCNEGGNITNHHCLECKSGLSFLMILYIQIIAIINMKIILLIKKVMFI